MGVRTRSSAGGAQFALAVGSSAVTLTVPNSAMVAQIVVRDNDVVFTRDGTAPTATKGTPAVVGAIINLNSRSELDKAQFIQRAAAATLDVEYFTDVSA